MKIEDLNKDAIKEYTLISKNDGFDKKSVDDIYFGYTHTLDDNINDEMKKVIFIEGQSTIFKGYKCWITFDEYRNILREYNINKLVP